MSSAAVTGSRLDEAFSGVFALLLTLLQRVRPSPDTGLGQHQESSRDQDRDQPLVWSALLYDRSWQPRPPAPVAVLFGAAKRIPDLHPAAIGNRPSLSSNMPPTPSRSQIEEVCH
jgi:hypothetical protein